MFRCAEKQSVTCFTTGWLDPCCSISIPGLAHLLMVFGLIGKPIPCFQVPWFHGLFFQLKPNTLATHHNFPISFPNFCWSPLVPQPPILCLSSDRARSRRDESFKRVVDVGAGTGRMASWLTTWGLEAEPWRWVSLSVESEQISCSRLTVIRLQRLFG